MRARARAATATSSRQPRSARGGKHGRRLGPPTHGQPLGLCVGQWVARRRRWGVRFGDVLYGQAVPEAVSNSIRATFMRTAYSKPEIQHPQAHPHPVIGDVRHTRSHAHILPGALRLGLY
eukprot:scaffold132365_cov72-Phaeocystis_antarctica.AAC.1